MKTSTRLALSLSTLVLFGGAATALGAPSGDAEIATKVVRFKDLDLSTGAGAGTLYERIAAAARVVCRGRRRRRFARAEPRAIEDAVRPSAARC